MITQAGVGLGRRRAVVNAAPDQLVGARSLQLPITDAGRQHHGMGQHRGSIVEEDPSRRSMNLQTNNASRSQQLGAKSLRLAACSVGELITGDPVRETEIVF